MKPILFDVTCLLPEKMSGVGVYTYQLFKGLKSIGVELSPVYKASRLFKDNHILSHLGQKGSAFLDLPNPFSGKGQIVHGTDFKLLSGNAKYHKVLTVHDLAVYREDLLDRSFCREGQAKMKAELDKEPDFVIVPTDFILGEFLTRFPKFKDRTRVVSHGCDHLLDAAMVDPRSVGTLIKKPFFLYVGHLETRKNVAALVKAFERFCEKVPDVDLLLVGKDGFGAEKIHRLVERSPYQERIRRLGFVGASTLKSLYQKSLAFVYPSLYEGFGMPIIEAMQLGAPVITSESTSTGEVASGGAHLVNPLEIDEIVNGLNRIYSDRAYRETLAGAGRERAQQFSWIQTARETLKIYKAF